MLSFPTPHLPAPSSSSAYRGSHESRRPGGTRVPLGKETKVIETRASSSLNPTHPPLFSPFSSPSSSSPGMEEYHTGWKEDTKLGIASDWLWPLRESQPLAQPPFSFFGVQNGVDLDAPPFAMVPSLSDSLAKPDPRSKACLNSSMSAAWFFLTSAYLGHSGSSSHSQARNL